MDCPSWHVVYPTVKGLGKITSKCRDSDSRDFSRMIKEWVTIRSLFICFFFLSAIFFPFDFYRIGRLRASFSLLVYWSPCNTKLTTCSMSLCIGYVKNRFASGQGEDFFFYQHVLSLIKQFLFSAAKCETGRGLEFGVTGLPFLAPFQSLSVSDRGGRRARKCRR